MSHSGNRLGIYLFVVVLTMSVSTAQGSESGAPDLAELQQCMRANLPSAARVRRFSMRTVEAEREQVLEGNFYVARDGDSLLTTIQIESPPDLAGGAFLVRQRADEEQMFVYIPSAQRVRRISGAGASMPLFGSALRYSDVKQLQSSLGAAQIQWLDDDASTEPPLHRLHIAMPADQHPLGAQIVARVDPRTCLLVDATVRRGEAVIRQLSLNAAPEPDSDGRWWVRSATIDDREAARTTNLELGNYEGLDELPGRLFSPTQFYRSR